MDCKFNQYTFVLSRKLKTGIMLFKKNRLLFCSYFVYMRRCYRSIYYECVSLHVVISSFVLPLFFQDIT